jgi:hypothetical protein
LLVVCAGFLLLVGIVPAQDAKSDKSNNTGQSTSSDQGSAADQNKPDAPVTDNEGTLRADGGSKPDSSTKNDKKDSANATVRLRIAITNDRDNPVPNASVYVRFPEGGGFLHHDKLAELGLKTNQDGTVKVPEIPQGKILIQVIAQGWHTYGKWYDIEKSEESIKIKLDPPPHWY